jgi:transcription initiation factor TFIIB
LYLDGKSEFLIKKNTGKSMGIPVTDIYTDYEKDDPCCPNPQIILNADAYWVCLNCGCVHRREYSFQERRMFSSEELNIRRQNEPLKNPVGYRTVIGYNTNVDGRGHPLPYQDRLRFYRLHKIQNGWNSSLERNYSESRPKLLSAANQLYLPFVVQETAWRIYLEAAKMRLALGRTIQALIAASLYAAIRIHELPRMLEEINEIFPSPKEMIYQALTVIIQQVLPKLQLRYRPVRIEPLLFRFGNELSLSMAFLQYAKELLRKAFKKGLKQAGMDPRGLAAAVIYLAGRKTDEKRTQSQIAEVTRITEVTLRTRVKLLIRFLPDTPI